MGELNHLSNGFTFLMVITGFATFVLTISASIAVDDEKKHAPYLVFADVMFMVLFLTSGFLAFATR